MGKVEARVRSFRPKKETWVPNVNRIERKVQPNITQPEYYDNGKRMSPTKLMYTIKQRVDNMIKESNGQKPREEDKEGVKSHANYFRFRDKYLKNPREHKE